jgi:cytochrome c oxidase assembly protein subunit 15
MDQKVNPAQMPIASWHRNLLTAAAIFSVLLIAMGGILCVTQSIRSCPDWPGCFGKFYPPLETSPILEYTHRVLAMVSGLLILGSAIAGLIRSRRQAWIVIPPLVTIVLVVEVSFFGARAVLYGLTPGWAAVDVGSALLVVALMITSALIAQAQKNQSLAPDNLSFRSPFARLVLVCAGVTYLILLSGVLVSGQGSVTGCLGWPIYSLRQFQMDGHAPANTLRLILSLIDILLILVVFVQAWRRKTKRPEIFRLAIWFVATFALEMLLQVFLLVFGLQIPILVPYTVVAAVFWGSLITLVVLTGLQDHRD